MKLPNFWAAIGTALAVFAPGILLITGPSAQAQSYSVLFSFHGKKGAYPYAGLVRDWKNNLYGTTTSGGAYGQGVVFKLQANGKEKVLHNFTGGADGAAPFAGLVRDSTGNLYGTTTSGGAYGYGVVFKLDPTGAETVLHSFTGGADGGSPYAGLVQDTAGNLYGTTLTGGAFSDWGVVFKLDPTGVETVLYSFTGGADGGNPYAGLVRAKSGNLYGTTYWGGDLPCDGGQGCGTVFKVDTKGNETVLYSFTGGGADGASPLAGVVRDSAGSLYGTTIAGGADSVNGMVFKLTTIGKETVLHSFNTAPDGALPVGGLVLDSAKNLYGTTSGGGTYGYGAVFKLDPIGTETVLYSFTGGTDGANPQAGLVRDKDGNLYGTAWNGGAYRRGVVFKITSQ